MKQKKLSLGRWLSCCAFLLLAGCATTSAPPDYTSQQMDFSAVRSVAVLPFLNLSSDDQAGERVRDAFMGMLLATEAIYVLPPGEVEAGERVRDAFMGMLLATEAIYVLPPGEVARGINLVGMRTPETPTIEEITKFQALLEVDAVITGVLREYGPVRSGSAEANLLSLSLQMSETQTGTTVWSASSTKGGISMSDRMLGSGGQPMNDVTIEAINDLLDQLFE
jgi:hypothetical protein